MNREIYSYLLHTYGRRPGFWFGVVCETTRTLLVRVIVVIIMSHTAAQLAQHDLAGAKHSILIFLVAYIIGACIGAVGELVAIRSENAEYLQLSTNFSRKLTGKDMSFYRDNQGGYLVSLFRQYIDSTMLLVRFFRIEAIRAFIGLAMPAVVLGFLDWRLGIVAGLVIAVQAIYIVWSSTKANKWRHLSHEMYRKTTAEVADAITNITAFKASGVDKQAHQRMADLAKQENETFWQRRKITTLLDLPRDTLTALGIAVALLVILSRQASDATSIGLIVLTITYMFQIVRTVGDLPSLITQHDDLITKLYPTLHYIGDSYETIQDPKRPQKLRHQRCDHHRPRQF